MNSKHINVTVQSSLYHLEINPSDGGNHDRVVLQELLSETAQTVQLNKDAQKSFKVIILNEADRMSKDAQHTLRRTMEKYTDTCRLILCCESLSKLIEPLRSRCLSIRVAAPTETEIIDVLNFVASKEHFVLPFRFAERIACACDGNLRRAVLMLEASRSESYPFSDKQDVVLPDWERFICAIANSIVEQQTSSRLLEIRSKLYELLQNCIPASIIIKTLLHELCKLAMDDTMRRDFVAAAATFEHRMQLGTKDIFHLEAFVAKVMFIYKKFVVQMMQE